MSCLLDTRPIEEAWTFCGGVATMDVRGISQSLSWRHRGGTSVCYGGLGTTAARGPQMFVVLRPAQEGSAYSNTDARTGVHATRVRPSMLRRMDIGACCAGR